MKQSDNSKRENQREYWDKTPEVSEDGIAEDDAKVEIVNDKVDNGNDRVHQQGQTRPIDVILHEKNVFSAEIRWE